jgi:hypothetical protein
MKILEHLTSLEGRLTAGVALIAAIVIGLWPDHARPIDPAKAAAVGTAGLAWLFAEIGGRRVPSEHDLKLFEQIVSTIPQQVLDFLKDQDFGVGSYNDPGTGALHEVAYWQGSRFEFTDSALNKKWLAVQRRIKEFANRLALDTFPVHDAENWRTVHPTIGDPEDPEPFVQARIDRLNEGATKVANEIDAFESFGRRRLGL